MKKIIVSIIGLCTFMLMSCSTKNETNKANAIPVYTINVNQSTNPEILDKFLSDMQIRLLPLETRDSMYFNGEEAVVHVADGQLFIHDVAQDMIFRFDKDGKFINRIARKGQGPEEYTFLSGITVANQTIYGLNRNKIQCYDYEGNYLKTIPLKYDAWQIAVRNDGTIFTATNYIQPYQFTVYSPDGTISDFMPSNPELLKLEVSQSTYHSLKQDKGVAYFTNYFDRNIYQFKDDSVSVMATLDFGSMNIPADFFQGEDDEIGSRFREYREKDKAIMKVDHLTISDDWLIFTPAQFDAYAVYYNRKNHATILNKDLEEPYNLLFGGYKTPDGYNPETGEFYRLVGSMDLKEVVEEIAENNPDYLDKYPFLKGIDFGQVDENSNDWVVFYKL